MLRACEPLMAIWSPFRNKPRFWPRHHSNLTAVRPRFSPPEAQKIRHFPNRYNLRIAAEVLLDESTPYATGRHDIAMKLNKKMSERAYGSFSIKSD